MTSPSPARWAKRLSLAAAAGALTVTATAIPAAADTDQYDAFLHENPVIEGVEPGGTVDVAPSFLQEQALPEDTVAISIRFSDSHHRIGIDLAGAEVVSDYDNCIEVEDGFGALECAVTDFEDLPGTTFTLSEQSPITYAVDESTVGPIDVCNCYFSVKALDAEHYAEQFGDLSWDEGSQHLLAVEASDDALEGGTEYDGTITISNTENPFDLSVGGVNVEGEAGDEVTVTIRVANAGPADADDRTDDFGSYELRAQLPAGLELVRLDSDTGDAASPDYGAWECFDPESLGDEYGIQQGKTELDHFDFACSTNELAAGDSIEFEFTVRITDAASAADGLIEIRERYDSRYTDSLDGDLSDNLAAFGVNAADQVADGGDAADGEDGEASEQLPTTGASMTVVGGIAAAALAAGAVMFVLVRRRRAGADW